MTTQIPAHYFRCVRMAVAAELYPDLDTATARVIDQGLDELQRGRRSDLIDRETGAPEPPRVEAGDATVSVRPTPEQEVRLRELIEGNNLGERFAAEEVLTVAFFYGLAQLYGPLRAAVDLMPCESVRQERQDVVRTRRAPKHPPARRLTLVRPSTPSVSGATEPQIAALLPPPAGAESAP